MPHRPLSNSLYFTTGGQHSRDISYLHGAKDVVCGGPLDAPDYIPVGYTNDKAINGLGKRVVNFPVQHRESGNVA